MVVCHLSSIYVSFVSAEVSTPDYYMYMYPIDRGEKYHEKYNMQCT